VVWNPWVEKASAMADLGDTAWRGMVCVETGNVVEIGHGARRMTNTRCRLKFP
jgi:D-hexose-6-phosphate mutarotase